MKKCKKCGVEKPLTEFYAAKGCKDGHRGECKQCTNEKNKQYTETNRESISAYHKEWRNRNPLLWSENLKRYKKRRPHVGAAWQARRRASKNKATPSWADLGAITKLYDKAAEYGFEVDHIVPLNSEIVCGLHCWHNLQLLSPELNNKKSNREWVDMPSGPL